MNILKNFFGSHENERNEPTDAIGDLPKISADTEIRLIKDRLEKKFGHKFKARVKVDGYIDKMEYRLVMDDYDAGDTGFQSHSVWGGSTENILDLNEAFVSGYWDRISRAKRGLENEANLSDFDRRHMLDAMDTAVAGSREELIMRAAVEGKI